MLKKPETSYEAYDKVSIEMLHGHWKKIVDALSALGTANYERISEFAFMDRHQIGRRLKELEEKEMVYKPGTKSLTKSGRKAYDYCLTGRGMPTTDNMIKEAYGKIKTEDPSENETFSKYKQASMF